MIRQPLADLSECLRRRRHRGLIWVAGDPSFCSEQTAGLIADVLGTGSGGRVFSDRPLPFDADIRPMSAVAEVLGQTLPWVIYDAFSGFNPNSFAQVAGTIAAGGWLILLSPAAQDWPAFNDPEYRRLLVEPWTPKMLEPRYLKRTARLLDADTRVLKLSAKGVRLPIWPAEPPSVSVAPPYMSLDQREVVERMAKALNRRRCALVLGADRGRGKSAALGLALARQAERKPLKVALTAPTREALAALLERVGALLEPVRWQGSEGYAGPLTLEYRTPAEMSERLPDADVLVVDEAAAIATPLLARLSRHYRRILFATTQHGYEGNGRGFTLRFLAELKSLVPDVRELGLQTPIRWASGDPLEALTSGLLLLDVEPDEPVVDADADSAIERLPRERLIHDEPLLRHLFGLLILAHYRTTPGDVRVLLDSPNLDVYILRQGGLLIGCALVAREGELSTALAEGVWQGVRRPTGHLLPQALIAHEGAMQVAPWRAWRVVRIAVHPTVQRRGLGSRLLQAIVERAGHEAVDYLGAGFAATPALLEYWRAHGFRPVRVGDQLDPVSGSHSVMVIRALSERACAWLPDMRVRYARHLRYRLNGTLGSLPTDLLPSLFADLSRSCPDASSRRLLEGFACYQRSVESVLLELDQLLLATVEDWPRIGLSEEEQNLLVARIWRQLPATAVSRPAGRKAQLDTLRRLVRRLLQQLPAG